MLITHEREKLINAILYFAQNTRYLGKTKLFKLLYFLDFEHYKETGRSVTGLEYAAWDKGPVPVDVYREFDYPEPDLAAKVRFTETPVSKGVMYAVEPVGEFDPSIFTKRELRILRQLAEEYRDATADEMIEATHLENSPWHQVYEVEGRRSDPIPYDYALSGPDAEQIQELAREHQETVAALRRRESRNPSPL